VPVDEEELLIWQDVLDQVAARRAEPLTCPHCGQKPLTVEESPTGVTRITCPACQRFVEGRFG
jgi:ribosomal protein L37AE/L43A